MHLQVCDEWLLAHSFFGLPRVRRVGGRVIGTGVCSTGGKVNCPVAVRQEMLGTEAEN